MAFTFYFPAVSGATDTAAMPSPERGNPVREIKVQSTARTMSGAIRVYDKGVSRSERDYTFEDVTDAKKTALQHLFDTHANGQATAFQIIDHHGTTLNARFLQSSLEWKEDNAETLPVTNALWSVEIKLEVWA